MKRVKKALLTSLLAALFVGLTGAAITAPVAKAEGNNAGSMQITLTDGIVVKYYVTLASGAQEAEATFTSDIATLNATVTGESVGNGEWKFVYDKVTPQYLDQDFSISIGGETLVTDYSVLDYLNEVKTREESTEAEKTVSQDLVYYGEAAKAYKTGSAITAEPATSFNGVDGSTVSGECTETDKIKSALVVFDSLPALRFNFLMTEGATVKVDGEDVTALLTEKNGTYSYLKTGVYATDFDKQFTVELINGEKTQTLAYSVNDYAARMQSSQNEGMKALAKALWCYGVSAEELLEAQTKFIVVAEPTYTATGLAKNAKGEEVVLPVLNSTNYTYAQASVSGGEYSYTDVNGGKATFTHSSGVVIEKPISGDSLTFNYTDYNCVDIHFKNKPSGLAAKYEGGVYVLALTNDVSIANMNFLTATYPKVKITGSYKLSLTSTDGATFNAFTIDNGTTFTMKGKLVAKELLVEKNGTLNLNVSGCDGVGILANGEAQIKGNVNIKNSNQGNTAIIIQGTGVTLELFESTRITIDNFEYGITGFGLATDSWTVKWPEGSSVVKEAPNWWPMHVALADGTKIVATSNLISNLALWGAKQVVKTSLTTEYDENTQTTTYTLAEGGTSILTSFTGKVVVKGNGTLKINANVAVTDVTVKSGASLVINGTFATTNMLVEEGASFAVNYDGGNACQFSDNGTIAWLGTVNVSRTTAGDATAIVPGASSVIELGANSCFTITNFSFGICRFNGAADVTLKLPNGATRDGNIGYKIGESYIFKMVASAGFTTQMGLWRVTPVIAE